MVETTIERNDIDLNRLLSWRKEFTILDDKSEAYKVYIRLVGDAEINRARVFALRKSAELRKKFRDETSDEHLAFIPDRDAVDKEHLVESLILYEVRGVTMEAYKKIEVVHPKEPTSDSSLEEQEKYQAEVDAYPSKVQDAVKAYVEKELDKKRKAFNKRSEEDLYNELKQAIIEQQCETEMYGKFKEICVYFGVYKDADYKERLFSSFEEFENLPSDTKTKFMTFYNSLEIGTDDLKN